MKGHARVERPAIRVLHSITKMGSGDRGHVIACASHGGRYAAALAAAGGVRAVIFNDAGLGLDRAGVAGLLLLEELGIAAAAVDARTAPIGDGGSVLSGTISEVNSIARALGCEPGMTARECAELMRDSPVVDAAAPGLSEGRYLVRDGDVKIWALDSVSLTTPALDDGQVIVTGSHAALLGGDSATAARSSPWIAAYNDAGAGSDSRGVTRLPALEVRGIGAVAVSAMSARIGDGRSSWESGVISHANRVATTLGALEGILLSTFVEQAVEARRGR